MRELTGIVAVLGIVAVSSSALADKLPKGSEHLAESEIIELYSGNSMRWDKDNVAYFASDGKVVSTFNFGGDRGYTVGTWQVTGDEICKNTTEWFNIAKGTSGKGSPDCWRWARKGRTFYNLWSVRFDGSKPNDGAWTKGENKKIKQGDLASQKIEAMKLGN